MKKSRKNVESPLLQNIPNFLSISRIIFTFIIVYLIFTNAPIPLIVTVFVIAALTDWFDGFLARRYRWTSEFGRKADMIADRFLWAGTALTFIAVFGLEGRLNWTYGVQLLFIMSRELITFPFALIAFVSGKPIPHARYIAKVTTFAQGFALPALILSLNNPLWSWISMPLSLVCAATGSISAWYYLCDIHCMQTRRRR